MAVPIDRRLVKTFAGYTLTLAMQALAKFDTLGAMAALECPMLMVHACNPVGLRP